MQVGPRGIALIKHFEGCPLTAYKCPAGIWTIGYGDTGAHVAKGLCWTQDQADDALAKRLAKEFAPGVEKAIAGAATTPGQFGAMVSLAYNIGLANFAKSSVLTNHRAAHGQTAAAAFALWGKARDPKTGELRELKGLIVRRNAEAALYRDDLDTFDAMVGYCA